MDSRVQSKQSKCFKYSVAILVAHLGCVEFHLGSLSDWLAATVAVATYCPFRLVEHPKTYSRQLGCEWGMG